MKLERMHLGKNLPGGIFSSTITHNKHFSRQYPIKISKKLRNREFFRKHCSKFLIIGLKIYNGK